MASRINYVQSKIIEQRFKIRHWIPYRVNRQSKYEQGRMYYNAYWGGCFTVISAEYDKYGVLDEVNVKWDDGNYGLMCTDLDMQDYLLEKDKTKLYNYDHIINDGNYYSGAEIVYWFFVHDITEDSIKYKGFWKFVDPFSQHRLSDFNKYTLSADYSIEKDIYYNCKAVKQK